MKNNTNNNNNIVVLDSVGYVFDYGKQQIYPSYKRGGWDVEDGTFIIEALANVEWLERLTDDEKHQIAMMGDNEVKFWLWFYEGNAVEISRNVYATQDTNYNNRLSLLDLMDYCLKNYYPQEVLRREIETSGEWIRVGRASVTPFWIHCESGEITDGVDVFDTNITDINFLVENDSIENNYLDDMTEGDITRLSYYFPKTISAYKMWKIRVNAMWLLNQVEGMDNTEERMVREIIALTK